MKYFSKSHDRKMNFFSGLIDIFDGLIEVLTLGYIHSSFGYEFVFWYHLRKAKRLAKERGEIWDG